MSWTQCSVELLAKLISQLCTEELLQPVDDRLELGGATYTFSSSRGAFGSYRVDPASIRRTAVGILGNDESEVATDPAEFLVDAASTLGLSGSTAAGYVAELTSTLAADVRLASTAVPNAELLSLNHSQLEGHLTGHPLLVANKGRLGFSADDSLRYTPEARTPLRLVWLAYAVASRSSAARRTSRSTRSLPASSVRLRWRNSEGASLTPTRMCGCRATRGSSTT
jgi:siderophore synthetase component